MPRKNCENNCEVEMSQDTVVDKFTQNGHD